MRTVALNASDVALENGQTYTIRLRVMGGSGLVTEQTRIFDVAWLAPAAPVLQLTEGEGRSATIDVIDTRYTSSGTMLEASSSMMESLTIYGASMQNGTPTPSAPVPIYSVDSMNLLDDSNVYNLAVSGSTIASNASYRAVWCEIPPASSDRAFSFVRNTVEGNRFRVYGTTEEPASGVTVNALFTSDDSALSGWFPVPQAYRYIFIYLSNAGASISAGNIAIYEDYQTAPDCVLPCRNSAIRAAGVNIARLTAGGGITESGGVFSGTANNFAARYGSSSVGVTTIHGIALPSTLAVSFDV